MKNGWGGVGGEEKGKQGRGEEQRKGREGGGGKRRAKERRGKGRG